MQTKYQTSQTEKDQDEIAHHRLAEAMVRLYDDLNPPVTQGHECKIRNLAKLDLNYKCPPPLESVEAEAEEKGF